MDMLGNLMGDFRKYLRDTLLPDALQGAIAAHCRVDLYTDNHIIIKELKPIFSSPRRRLAGLIIDVSFDHFLSRHWQLFNCIERGEFIRKAYRCLSEQLWMMPPPMQRTVTAMIEQDWLGSYEQIEGVERALDGIARRIRFRNCLQGAGVEVRDNYATLENAFLEFYPQLQEYVRSWPREPAWFEPARPEC